MDEPDKLPLVKIFPWQTCIFLQHFHFSFFSSDGGGFYFRFEKRLTKQYVSNSPFVSSLRNCTRCQYVPKLLTTEIRGDVKMCFRTLNNKMAWKLPATSTVPRCHWFWRRRFRIGVRAAPGKTTGDILKGMRKNKFGQILVVRRDQKTLS